MVRLFYLIFFLSRFVRFKSRRKMCVLFLLTNCTMTVGLVWRFSSHCLLKNIEDSKDPLIRIEMVGVVISFLTKFWL